MEPAELSPSQELTGPQPLQHPEPAETLPSLVAIPAHPVVMRASFRSFPATPGPEATAPAPTVRPSAETATGQATAELLSVREVPEALLATVAHSPVRVGLGALLETGGARRFRVVLVPERTRPEETLT